MSLMGSIHCLTTLRQRAVDVVNGHSSVGRVAERSEASEIRVVPAEKARAVSGVLPPTRRPDPSGSVR